MTGAATLTELSEQHSSSSIIEPVSLTTLNTHLTEITTIGTLASVTDELRYAGAIHPELRTIVPFDVCFERTENGYAAVVQELDEYGVGDTRSEALEDLRKTLQELYLALERDQSRLSADLFSVWTRLTRHIARIRR